MKLKPVPQRSCNPTKALREAKLFQNQTEKALPQLQSHGGRWLINKHLPNPLWELLIHGGGRMDDWWWNLQRAAMQCSKGN